MSEQLPTVPSSRQRSEGFPESHALERIGPKASPARLTRDFVTFAGKLLLNASIEVIMLPLGALAFASDIVTKRSGERSRFYAVMRLGKRWDDWLNTFRPASEVRHQNETFGKSAVAGADEMIASLEAMIASGELPKRYRGQVEAWGQKVRRSPPSPEDHGGEGGGEGLH